MADSGLTEQIAVIMDKASYISRLFRERHIGDYDFKQIITREEAEKDFSIASELVNAIKQYLQREGFSV